MTLERDEALEKLLDVERTIPETSVGMKERVLERVLDAGMLPPVTSSGSGGGPGDIADVAASSASSAAKLWAVASMAFLGGAIFGAGVYHATQNEPIVVEAAETPAPEPETTPLPIPSIEAESDHEEPPPEPDVMREERAPRPPPVPRITTEVEPAENEAPEATPEAAPEASESELAEERALIDVARSALGRHRPASALSALERHAARFPDGHLTQEREGLLVLAYARAGRMDDARREAEEFRRRYPRSLMNQAIDSVLNE